MTNDSIAASAPTISNTPSENFTNSQYRAAVQSLRACVEINPKKMSGQPVLRGTRFPIEQVVSQMADGDSIDDIAKNFDLDRNLLSTFLHSLATFARVKLSTELD